MMPSVIARNTRKKEADTALMSWEVPPNSPHFYFGGMQNLDSIATRIFSAAFKYLPFTFSKILTPTSICFSHVQAKKTTRKDLGSHFCKNCRICKGVALGANRVC